MSKFKPLNDKVLIRRAKAQTSKGGILLPDSAQEKPKEGVVVSVGPGRFDDNGQRQTLSVKEGDRVLFSNYAGTEVKSDDENEEFLIVSEKDILGIVG